MLPARLILTMYAAGALVLLMAGGLQASGIAVLTPANNSYVGHEQLSVVLVVDNREATAVQIVVGGKKYSKAVPKDGASHQVCLPVTLARGLNTVELSVSGSSGVIERSSLQVYLRSAVLKPYQNPPDGFQRYYFHLPASESACSACHRMEATLFDLTPERPDASPCYPCHKNKGKNLYPHKPVAAGACFSCHEVVKGKRKYTTRQPVQEVCFRCHSAQGRQWKAKKVRHGPAAVGNCTLCHDPHGSDWQSLVHMHPTDLCINCHNDKKNGLHVIAGFFAKGHPVKGPSNPLKKDQPFSCAGCHNPHAGDTQNLLNKDRDSLAVYCQSCHKL